jgi:hypothetical protein
MILGGGVVVVVVGKGCCKAAQIFAGKHNPTCCRDDEKVRHSLRNPAEISSWKFLKGALSMGCKAIVFPYTPILIRYFRIAAPADRLQSQQFSRRRLLC